MTKDGPDDRNDGGNVKDASLKLKELAKSYCATNKEHQQKIMESPLHKKEDFANSLFIKKSL